MSQELNYEMKFGPLGAPMDALMIRRKLDKGVAEVFVQCLVEGAREY